MKGSEAQLLVFMEGANNRYVIPVYQRKYDWKIDNCKQLYNDLKKIIKDNRNSHFFGSIVSSVVPNGSKIEFHIIDGQQRLTTITLLLLAISNLIKKGLINSKENELNGQIMERFIIAKWAENEDRIKLRPIKSDRSALKKLIYEDEEEFERASNLTINYKFFCNQILKKEVTVDELYEAIGKLQIISITLEATDNAQLIFESLNSTGLALTEGDKIRNYILMGLSTDKQDEYYEKYWTKIENSTKNNVSAFVRDYLSIKQQVTPTINNVYQAFKRYFEALKDTKDKLEKLLENLKKYAKFYNRLITGNSGLKSKALDDCLYRLNRLEITVAEPFFMEIFSLNQEDKLSVDDVTRIFKITENYLFRRNICDVPTNALNKIFLKLNNEIIRCDNTTNNYVDKFIYELLSKKESGRFPNDDEFTEALSDKQIYQMRGKYKAYLFERFENYGTVETKDVYTLLDNGTYSIEHIMPQHLTPAWTEALGINAEGIHSTWLHRLGNLTLTGYNSNMSNSTFEEKRDSQFGFKASGLKMNQKIAQKDSWGLEEIEERSSEMVDFAVHTIWQLPTTEFKPIEKEFDSYTLDDDNYDVIGRKIVKYSYQNSETQVSSWADMFEHVVKYLHSKDKSVLSNVAYKTSEESYLYNYFDHDETKLRNALKIDDDIFAEKDTNTTLKISILRRLFALYNTDTMDLVFYLRDAEQGKAVEEGRFNLRNRYWTYALAIIQDKNAHRGTFDGRHASTENWVSGSFGIGGFNINCIANYDEARVDFYIGKQETLKNKEAFDVLFSHKADIEDKLGVILNWNRADNNKASNISYKLSGVSIEHEEDWPRMAEFHSEWSDKICNVLLPYLKELYPSVNLK